MEGAKANAQQRNMPSKEEQLNDKQRIGFLNQCKLELSAELIKHKEENVKIKKERDCAVKQIDEQQIYINKLSRKNHELETSLFLSWEENKRLRMRTLAIGEENAALHEKLSKTKYYSFPHNRFENSKTETGSSVATESWEDVSKKLFLQMQKEMKEMQQLSQSLANRDKSFVSNTRNALPKDDEGLDTEVYEARIASLVLECDALKQHMKVQNEKLRYLLNSLAEDSPLKPRVTLEHIQPPKSVSHSHSDTADENRLHSKKSDETFRAYFTQQLSKSSSDEKKLSSVFPAKDDSMKTVDVPSKVPKQCTVTKIGSNKNLPNPSEKKLCPICKVAFPVDISDKEFEAHVILHLESVGAKLMDNYDMV